MVVNGLKCSGESLIAITVNSMNDIDALYKSDIGIAINNN